MPILLDLEATCWFGKKRGGFPELIELAAIFVDDELSVQDEFHSYVKPSQYPLLSPDCIQFTGITQDVINAAPADHWVYGQFKTWIDRYPDAQILTWGPNDQNIMLRELKEKKIHSDLAYCLDSQMTRIDMIIQKTYQLAKTGLYNVMSLLDLPVSGRPHSAICDTYNMFQIYKKYCQDGYQ